MSTATTHMDNKPSLQASHCEDKGRSKRKQSHTLAPALRFNEFDGDWNLKELKEICSFFSGGTPTSTDNTLYSGDIPFIGSGNIYDSKVSNYITEKALNNSSAKLVEVGDLLYALYGANSGEVAISKMYGAVNQAILCIRTKSEKIDFVYSLLFLNKEKIVTKYLQGGQGNLSANIIKNLKYHFPSLPEQQKIASFLSAVDEKIQQLTKKEALLEQYKKGVMQQLFSGQLRFKDENGNPYPDWEEKKLSNCIEFIAGYAFKSVEMKTEPSTYQILKMSNVYKSKLQLERSPSYWEELDEKQAKYLLRKKDILLTLTGTVGKMDYGYSVVIPENNKFLLNQRLVCLRCIDGISDGGFINNLVKTSRFFYFFFGESKGGTGNQTNVGIQDLRDIKLSFPILFEQQKIASYLSGIDTKIEAVNIQITQNQTFKKGLLQQMFV